MDSYCFRLADGMGWQFMGASAHKAASLFVEKFAEIVGLRAAEEDGHRKIFFLHTDEVQQTKDGPLVPGCGSEQSGTNRGWVVYDHNSLKIWCHESIPDVICEVCDHSANDSDIVSMWHALQPIYQQAQNTGGLPLHGALLEIEGKGVVIAAPGDTGKSTCCRRVPVYWKPLCDDELLVVFDKERGYQAHPFPTWSDYLWKSSEKRWNVEYSVPMKAVFFLEQAEADEVIPVGNGQAAMFIYQFATQVCQKFWGKMDKEQRRGQRKHLFNNASEMAKAIPAYRLRATLDGRFWEEIEKQLNHGQPGSLKTGPLP
jgi:SynChlorMet cassette protein ScmC